MRPKILVDTGPLVAYLCEDEYHHVWAVDHFKAHARPLLTCEAVMVEATFLLRRAKRSHEKLLDLIACGAIAIGFDLEGDAEVVSSLMTQYNNVPMDLADACLVRMTEWYPDSTLLTLDSDFQIYRKHRREIISVIIP